MSKSDYTSSLIGVSDSPIDKAVSSGWVMAGVEQQGIMSKEKWYMMLNWHWCYEQHPRRFVIVKKEDICLIYKVSLS